MVAITGELATLTSDPLQVTPVRPATGAIIGSSEFSVFPFIEGFLERFNSFLFSSRGRRIVGCPPSALFGARHFRGRIHLFPEQFDMGTVLTSQTRDWELFNGLDRPISVTSIVGSGVSGFTISQGDLATPFTIPQFGSELYTVQVSADGPDVIAASYTYTTAAGEIRVVSFTGQRLIFFSIEPQKTITERWAFRTDITREFDGKETSRRAIRDAPRVTLSYTFVLEELRAAKWDNQQFDWNRRLWAVSDWTQAVFLTSAVSPTDTQIFVSDTTDRDFREGLNESLVIWVDEDTFETMEIDTVNQFDIVGAGEIAGSFPVGTRVMPVRLGYGNPTIAQKHFVVGARTHRIDFAITRNVVLGDLAAALPTSYLGDPIFTNLLTVAGRSYAVRMAFGSERFDPDGVGYFAQHNLWNSPETTQPIRMFFDDRAEYVLLRKLIHGTWGRQKRFWLPSYRDDFVLEQDRPVGTLFRAEPSLYSQHVFPLGGERRKNIEIEYIDGTIDRRHIESATDVTTFEEIEIDSASSQALSIANVAQIRFLNRVRFGLDTFVVAYDRLDHGIIDATFVHIEQ